MSFRWTRLHAVLGRGPENLAYEMLEQAVSQGVVEHEDLDWKRAMPTPGGADELAKDIAAMANTRGGLIVFGVGEQRGTGQAASLIDQGSIKEDYLRFVRATAMTRIQPGVSVEITLLAGEVGTALAVKVPVSEQAPHLVSNGVQWLAAPYRLGPHTHWMNEAQLARAYADRFDRGHRQAGSLQEDVADTAELLDVEAASWLVAVARRRQPLNTSAPAPSASDARDVLARALSLSTSLHGASGRLRPLRDLGDAALNPRVGLRRWVAHRIPPAGPDGRPTELSSSSGTTARSPLPAPRRAGIRRSCRTGTRSRSRWSMPSPSTS